MTNVEVSRSFDTHRTAVHGWAFRILGNHEDASDVTQEVFMKWWRTHRDESTPRNAVAWLRRVTINQSISLLRLKKRHELSGGGPPATATSAVDRPLERKEIANAVSIALEDVSEHQREVLIAKVYDGYTFAEIARQMQLAVPTIKTHYLRALRTVRRRLNAAGFVQGDWQ